MCMLGILGSLCGLWECVGVGKLSSGAAQFVLFDMLSGSVRGLLGVGCALFGPLHVDWFKLMDLAFSSPSPGSDDLTALATTSGMNMDTGLAVGQNQTLRHQGVNKSGGFDSNNRVLYCTNVNLSLDYECLYSVVKQFGKVERIKLILEKDKQSFCAFIKFSSPLEASEAQQRLHGHILNDSVVSTKVFSVKNLNDEPFDFVPKAEEHGPVPCTRALPPPLWHVAIYKEGGKNLIKAADCIESKVGSIPIGNLKRYGKNLLIKAGNETQAVLLANFKPPESGNIESISSHRFFNTLKGVVYSKDLHVFKEEEILHRCPPCVSHVKKLGGDAAILLTFSSNYLPDTIIVGHERMQVKKYKRSPRQCRKCFEYGHIQNSCDNNKRCPVCSAEHDNFDDCKAARYCFLCKGDHTPNSRACPRYKFEQEVLAVADNEHISISEAKRTVMGANKSANTTYASVIKLMKTSNNVRPPITVSDGRYHKPGISRTINNNENLQTGEKLSSASALKSNSKNCTSKSTENLSSTTSTAVDSSPKIRVPKSANNSGKYSENTSNQNKLKEQSQLDRASSEPSIATATNKNNNKTTVATTKKRTRNSSPNNDNFIIKTSNGFSVLEDISPPRKVVPKVVSEQKHLSSIQSCRPKTNRISGAQNHSNNSEHQVHNKKYEDQPKTLNTNSDEKGLRKQSLIKENFPLHPRNSTSPPRSGK